MASSGSFERWWWNAQRFGLTPAKLISRLSIRQGPLIVSNSLPKAGTHLLERALCRHRQIYRAPVRTLHQGTLKRGGDQLSFRVAGLRPNQMLVTHLEFTPERADILKGLNVRSLFMVRDPRDIVVSQAHFIAGRSQHPHHALFATAPDILHRFRLVIEGAEEQGFLPLRDRLELYAGWLASDSLVVRYEDLVGAGGGGGTDRQLTTLAGIFSHLGLVLAPDKLSALAAETFSTTSPTFRRGTIGQWLNQFDDATLECFERLTGDIAARYGYPARERSHLRAEDPDASQ